MRSILKFTRTWVPALLILSGAVMIVIRPDITGVESGAMMLGCGLGVLALNRLQQLGHRAEVDREVEQDARAFFKENGYWPGERDDNSPQTVDTSGAPTPRLRPRGSAGRRPR